MIFQDQFIFHLLTFIDELQQQFHLKMEQIHVIVHTAEYLMPRYQFYSHKADQISSMEPYINKSHKIFFFFS